ncbi:Basement membrane-specific heparan sulfate proteoglycan core protein [Chionoecetes opilio]|uniref:Basement membrane-specific heparan sulfate proteoglycan core protein n=1 Tax=Chionoecetes opilio TaxID=41210 RepID=A0A8J4Z375_CHIOP|nr:Basement membrane-specific heparan sulfate proteoglycan core protein [Chionoecetes opilio]
MTVQGRAPSRLCHGITVQGRAPSRLCHGITVQGKGSQPSVSSAGRATHVHGITVQGRAPSRLCHGMTVQGRAPSRLCHGITVQGRAPSRLCHGITVQGRAPSRLCHGMTVQGRAPSRLCHGMNSAGQGSQPSVSWHNSAGQGSQPSLPPPNSDSFSLVGANQDQTRGNYVVRDNEYPLSPRHLSRSRPGSQYSDRVVLNVDRSKLRGPGDLVVYFSLPTSHKGQQLKTFGGYLHYRISYSYFGASQTTEHPDVIMRGNNLTLMHVHDGTFHPDIENQVDVRFFYGQWFKQVSLWGGRMQIEQPATRQEIMMVMENMDMLLIRALYTDGDFINTTLSNVQMDTAEISRNDQGQAVLVEKCLCPQGYGGMSCQSSWKHGCRIYCCSIYGYRLYGISCHGDCAPNYTRMREGSWLGRCVSNLVCGPNEYGDPANGIPCLPCPCPLANPNNQ